jgi:hypothetical protein
MQEDAEFLATLWASMKPYIPKKEALEAAGVFLRTLEDHADVDAVIDNLRGHDNTLDAAITEIYGAPEEIIASEDEDEELDFDNINYDYDEE